MESWLWVVLTVSVALIVLTIAVTLMLFTAFVNAHWKDEIYYDSDEE